MKVPYVVELSWAYPGTAQFFWIPPIISGTGKATDYKFGQYIQRVHLNKSLLKFLRKGSVGVSRDCPIFWSTPYYLRNGKSYGFQILHAHLYAQSEQKPIKTFGISSSGHCQGLPKIFRAPIYIGRIVQSSLR